MSVTGPIDESEQAYARLEELLRRLDERLAEVQRFVVDVANDIGDLRAHSDTITHELETVESRLMQLRPAGAAEGAAGPYTRCQECGGAVIYQEAVAGWSTACPLCHWTDFQDDAAHANPPPNVTYAARTLLRRT